MISITEAKAILLVEDMPLNMELAEDLLSAAGYRVVPVSCGEDAITLAVREKPDLILMDIDLPGIDGLEATRQIRKNPVTANIPVVAFTALVMMEQKKSIMNAGCVGVIEKPIDTRRFARTVAGFFE